MGKPKEKRFKVGADLVITPIERFTISKSTDTGNMIIVAAKNIDPAAPIPVLSNISNVWIESILIYSYESNIVLRTIRWPSIAKKITSKNNIKIWLITGVEAPVFGSTWAAKARPEVLAIFSPASDAAENQIVKIKPALKPIAISLIIRITPIADVMVWISIKSLWCWNTLKVSTIPKSILTGNKTYPAPKIGEEIKKALILILQNKNNRILSWIICSSKPGSVPILLIGKSSINCIPFLQLYQK